MKSSISPRVPFQPIPTTWTLPTHFLLTASTEAASPLQVTQYGAQNQKATGDPEYREPKSPSGAVAVADAVAVAAAVTSTGTLAVTASCAHAARVKIPAAIKR